MLEIRRSGQPLVVHCWRGGLRSEAVASFLSVIGVDCWRLTGGYKAWRQQVLSDFAAGQYDFIPVVLDGLTGVGKTEILAELSRLGNSVLNLEALANHRGSVFGGMGLSAQPTQKNYDAALWLELRKFGKEPVFMEAESRKVGRLSLPDCVFDRIASGHKVLVTGTLPARCQRIVSDYARTMNAERETEAVRLLHTLKERLGARRVVEIEEIARSGDLSAAVEILLIEYYDPLYAKQINRSQPFQLEVNGDDVPAAAQTIAKWAENLAAAADRGQGFTPPLHGFVP
jgi:tRNA 2-selenouridine synthase